MARHRPDSAALVCGERTLTFGDLARGSREVAGKLISAGARCGDRVAVLMSPSPRLVEIYHALQMIGCASIVLDGRASANELVRQIDHAEAKLLCCDHDHRLKASNLSEQGVQDTLRLIDGEDELDSLAPSNEIPESMDLMALHSIVYTSGTSARPKPVMLTNANHAASASGVASRLGIGAADRWLAAMPLCHVGGQAILLRSVLNGFSVELHRRFDAVMVHKRLIAGGITLVSLVPTMLARLLRLEGVSASRLYPSSLRCVVVGGAALSEELMVRARTQQVPVVASYGLSETASQVTTASLDDDTGSCGLPLEGVSLRIADANADGWGEILIRGAQVTPGYFREQALTNAAIRGGWLWSGDIGRLDERGRLHVACRRSDLIVSGGENVSPLEVEAVLEGHEAVVEALVFAVEDDEWGQCVEALIVTGGEASPSDVELVRWCRTRLAGYKIPRRFRRVAALPRTLNGKLLRTGR